MTHSKPRPLLVLALFVAGLGLFLVGALILWIGITPTPDIASFANREVTQSTKIYDRTGQILLYDYNRDARRDVVPLSAISQNAINATIAIEDSSFYKHGGVRITSIIRAALADIFGGGPTQGGSTITQQVVKNTLLTKGTGVVQKVRRKVREWILATKMESLYSKDQILETYLNDIPYGGTLYGIESASEAFFGVTAKDLSIAQAAYLAAVLQAPTYFSPYGTHRTELDARKNLVLSRMKDLGFITEEERKRASEEVIEFATQRSGSIVAPHFVFYVIDQLREKYGESALTSGLKVITTLDADLQTRAEAIVANYAEINEKNFKATNEAMIALDPGTGQILSMVGSRDFFDTKIDGQYNATLASRQPGSTFKPFVYALALQKGYTRNTVVFDVPTQFSTACDPTDVHNSEPPCYAPQNFDEKFRGPMTFESALAQSINIPAVKVLYLVGVRSAVAFAESFGLTSLGDPDRYGLTLVLGGGEVRLIDLTSAYGVFAADGVRHEPAALLEVADGADNVLEQYAPSSTQVIPESIARDISGMLSDNPARVPSYALNNPFNFPGYDVAAKTGTTNDTRDAWVIGYTPSIAIGAWAGNNDNTPMVKSVAGYIVAPMWHELMAYAITKYPKKYFGEPSQITTSLPPMLRGVWQIGDASGQIVPHDLLYWTDKTNPQGPAPSNPANDAQFVHWEFGLQSWFASNPGVLLGPPLPLFVPVIDSSASPST